MLADLSKADVVNLIASSREETNDFVSQEIKDFYYIARSQALIVAKAECIVDILKDMPLFAD